MKYRLWIFGSVLLPWAAAAAKVPSVWLCVGSSEFRQAAAPLIAQRQTEGFTVKQANGPAVAAIAACEPKPDFIVLLGDEIRGAAVEGSNSWRLAAARRPYHGWQDSHPEKFVSDMALGDFDDDGLPDASVGRIPARSAAEVAAAAEKIVQWEQRSPVLSDLTLPVWAGDPGFGSFFRDMALGFFFPKSSGVRRCGRSFGSCRAMSAARSAHGRRNSRCVIIRACPAEVW